MPGHEDWLKKAQSDLKMARKGLKDDDDTLDCVVYHTHQYAEKALKGFYVFNGKPVDRTHDLEYLLKICCDADVDFICLKDCVKKLNPFAVLSRYPDDRFCVNRIEAEEAVRLAKNVYDFVLDKIEKPDPNIKMF